MSLVLNRGVKVIENLRPQSSNIAKKVIKAQKHQRWGSIHAEFTNHDWDLHGDEGIRNSIF